MKINLQSFLVCALLLFTSCKSGSSVTDSGITNLAPEVTLSTSQATTPVTFNASSAWTVSLSDTKSAPSWLVVRPMAGSAGNCIIRVTAQANTGYTDRIAYVTIKSGSATQVVAITQKQTNAILLTQNNYNFTTSGGSMSVEVQSNLDYDVTIPSDASWITQTVSETKTGLVGDEKHFAIAASPDSIMRTAQVVFQSKTTKDKAIVTIVQEPLASLSLDVFYNTFYDKSLNIFYYRSDHEMADNTGIWGTHAAIWTQATYMDMLLNAYKRSGDPRYKTQIDKFYAGACKQYANFDWTNQSVWFIYDDMMWWIGTLARMYEVTGEQKYLEASLQGFNYVYNQAYDAVDGGGMYWNFPHDYKSSCINYPTVVAAMTLYNITKDAGYMDKAKSIYDWSRILFENGAIADGAHRNANGWTAIDKTTLLYNQGAALGAATLLYKATKDQSYLDDAIAIADYTKDNMTYSNGILEYKAGVEQGIYAAIFAQYIIRLIEDGNQPQYLPWIQYNVDMAWKNRSDANLTYKDAVNPCPTGALRSFDASPCPALWQVLPTN